jgi:hypothetical protein
MTTELLVLAVAVVLVGLVVAFLLRRRFLLSGLGAVTMWLRPTGSPRWSVGVAWYGGDSLLWYRALSLSVRPQQRLCRAEFRCRDGAARAPGTSPCPRTSSSSRATPRPAPGSWPWTPRR